MLSLDLDAPATATRPRGPVNVLQSTQDTRPSSSSTSCSPPRRRPPTSRHTLGRWPPRLPVLIIDGLVGVSDFIARQGASRPLPPSTACSPGRSISTTRTWSKPRSRRRPHRPRAQADVGRALGVVRPVGGEHLRELVRLRAAAADAAERSRRACGARCVAATEVGVIGGLRRVLNQVLRSHAIGGGGELRARRT